MATGVGNRIREARKLLGLSQDDLAKRMGLKNKSSICKVERGDDNLTTDTVKKYAAALNCTPAYLMGWEDQHGNETIAGEIADAYAFANKMQQYNRDQINEAMELYAKFKSLSPADQIAIQTLLGSLETSSEIPHLN